MGDDKGAGCPLDVPSVACDSRMLGPPSLSSCQVAWGTAASRPSECCQRWGLLTALKSPGAFGDSRGNLPKSIQSPLGFLVPREHLSMASKDSGTEALWEIQRRFRRHLHPPTRRGLPVQHQACQRAGFALSPVLVTSSGSEQPPPTKSKAPTAWCSRPQREDISQAPSRISRDLGRLVIDTGLWQSVAGSAPARGPACGSPEASITTPASQVRKQPDRQTKSRA